MWWSATARPRSPSSATPTTSARTTTTRSSPSAAPIPSPSIWSARKSTRSASRSRARAKRSRSPATVPRAAGRPTAGWRSTSSPSSRDEREERTRQGPHQLRRSGVLALPSPLVRKKHGLLGRDARAPGGRHRRLEERLQQLPPPFPRADRGGEARRARRRRAADRVSHRLARRGVPQPDLDDVPQPDGDRRRGDDPRPADERGGAGPVSYTHLR